MKYQLSDRKFKFERCGRWQMFNKAHCFDSRGGLSGQPDIYSVTAYRLWNLEYFRTARIVEDHEIG